MDNPRRFLIKNTPEELVLVLPAPLRRLREIGWIFVAVGVVVALLPAALWESEVAAAVGLGGVAVATWVVHRGLARRYAATLTLRNEGLTVDCGGRTEALPWAAVAGGLRSDQVPPLRELEPHELDWVQAVVRAYADPAEAPLLAVLGVQRGRP